MKYFELVANYNELKIEDQIYQNIEMEINKDLQEQNESVELISNNTEPTQIFISKRITFVIVFISMILGYLLP